MNGRVKLVVDAASHLCRRTGHPTELRRRTSWHQRHRVRQIVACGTKIAMTVRADRPAQLWLAGERAKSLWRSAVGGTCFEGRGDFEQERLIERPPEKFHCHRNLIGLGAFEPAAVRIA